MSTKRDLRTPDQLEGALRRGATVTIGGVTGELAAVYPTDGYYVVVVMVGRTRTEFRLWSTSAVEVHRAG